MQKQKLVFNHLLGLGRSTPSIRKTTSHWPKKTKTMPIEKTGTETKIRLSSVTPHLLIVSLRPTFSRKTNVMEAIKEVIQPLGLMSPRWPKKIKIRLRTWAISSVILASKKDIMSINAPKSQKTSYGLSNFYVNDWKNRGSIEADILHLVFCYFQGSDWGPAGLGKQSQRNKPGFYPSARPHNLKN